jgi:hypothetical protein
MSYVPNADFHNGTETFAYVISDGKTTATANEVINITQLVAVDDFYTMPEDGAPLALHPLNGDSDADGDVLTLKSINGVTLIPGVAQTIPVTNGVLNVSGSGEITYIPNPNFTGTETFAYVVDDGKMTATANEIITVTPQNDAPLAVTDNYAMLEGSTSVVLNPLQGDSDPDGDVLTLQSINGVNLTPGVAQTIPVTHGVVNVSADGVMSYVPNADFHNGTETFAYVISDGKTTATANEVINITELVAVDDFYTMPEDGAPDTSASNRVRPGITRAGAHNGGALEMRQTPAPTLSSMARRERHPVAVEPYATHKLSTGQTWAA